MTSHSFDIDDAKEHGLTAAVLLQNLRFWIQHNKANGTHEHGGRTWTYNSAKAFAELFPYLSAPQIKRTLRKLVDDGVLLSRTLSENSWDRVNWYAFAEEDSMLKMPAKPVASHGTKLSRARDESVPTKGQLRLVTGQIENQMENTDGNHMGKLLTQPARVSQSKPKTTAKERFEASGFDALEYLKAKGVDEQVCSDWIHVRELKGGFPFQSVIDKHEADAENAGITLQEALEHVICSGVFDFDIECYFEYSA